MNIDNSYLNKLYNYLLYGMILLFFSYYGINYMFYQEHTIWIKKMYIESVVESYIKNKTYYVLKFKSDSVYYSIEITNPNTTSSSSDITLREKLLSSSNKKKKDKKDTTSIDDIASSLSSTTSTMQVDLKSKDKQISLPQTPIIKFESGDSIFIELRLREYPLYMKSTKKFKIQGYDAKIYSGNF